VLGQVRAELDPQRRLVLREALAILGRQVDRVLRRDERATAGLDLAVLELLRELARDLDRLHGHANDPADGSVDTCSMPLSMLRRKPMPDVRARPVRLMKRLRGPARSGQ